MENAHVIPDPNNGRPRPSPTNPYKLITSLNRTQAITLVVEFLGWTLDAFDFFTVSFA
ncbi:10771_t:CDS:1, partial [Cetraspora pellucida]